MRQPADTLRLFDAIERTPYAFDFFKVMRRIECAYANKPRLGQALRPQDEAVRLAQEPALDFAPATLSAFSPGDDKHAPRLAVRFFGLLGPNGPMPTHFTEYVRDRLLHAGDPTFARFLDLFHHRMLLLFYRAWAQAQPTVALDRPEEDRFASYVGSLFGLGLDAVRERDSVPDDAKRFQAGWLARQVRNRDGLVAVLSDYFQLPVRVEEFCGHWMRLSPDDRVRLGRRDKGLALGLGVTAGGRIWDRQHKIRIWLGPLDEAHYRAFLPGGQALRVLVDWVRQYLGFELEWDVRLTLVAADVPRARLGRHERLGWTTWLGRRRGGHAAADLTLDAERLVYTTTQARGERHE